MNGTQSVRDCRQSSKCRDCGELVLWVRWPKSGKKMPINAQPKQPPCGRILITYRPQSNELIAEMIKPGTTPPPGRKLFESHWATCAGGLATQIRKNKPPQGSARTPDAPGLYRRAGGES
jgi:hypothetical protein